MLHFGMCKTSVPLCVFIPPMWSARVHVNQQRSVLAVQLRASRDCLLDDTLTHAIGYHILLLLYDMYSAQFQRRKVHYYTQQLTGKVALQCVGSG